MGAVKSRRQSGGSNWHRAVSTSARKKKPGSPDYQEQGKDHNRQIPPLFSRNADTKSDHSLVFASTNQNENCQPSSRLSSSRHLATAVVAADIMPLSQTPVCDKNTPSLECSSDQFQTSQNKKQEDALYQHLNLDTHPAVTRLQNEQNLRLEGMEQRMNKIRKSAQQEAERRKFAHLFRAKSEDKVQTEKLLKEASVALQLFKKERQMKKSSERRHIVSCDEPDTADVNLSASHLTIKQENDKGDIIPVHIVSENSSPCQMKQSGSTVDQPLMWLLQPVERFHLNGLVLWLVLPFLLPVLLLLHLIRHLSPPSDSHSSKKN